MAFTLGGGIVVAKSQVGLGNVNNVEQLPLTDKGAANGVATLDGNGIIPLAQMPASTKNYHVVADITERDALTAGVRFEGMRVAVLDASADSTVNSGLAIYMLKSGLQNADFVKISEEESMDVDTSVFLHKTNDTLDDINPGTTNKQFTGTEKTKLSGIAEGATANATDADLRARSSHTGTQLASTISDFSTAVTGVLDARAVANVPTCSDSSALAASSYPFSFVVMQNDSQSLANGLYFSDGTSWNALFEF